MKICPQRFAVIAAVAIFLSLATTAHALKPTGYLDVADQTTIAGWAKDPDKLDQSIHVHIYIDGQLTHDVIANQPRPDAGGNYGFSWTPPTLPPGDHTIEAYGIGIDSSGAPDNLNRKLNNIKTYTSPRFYTLTSPDTSIAVDIDAQMGGIISRIQDQVNNPNVNLIKAHAGAGIQYAFWQLPRYSAVPPNCPSNRDDMWYLNPTQGGYYSGLDVGNPIGIFGTLPITQYDTNEFIRFENNGKTIHLKSRFIRHDYCLEREARWENRNLWDTNFYIEQWVQFDSRFTNTLKITSKITNVGATNITVDTRGFIAFTDNLDQFVYPSGGNIIKTNTIEGQDLILDQSWSAVTKSSTNAGFGFVIHPEANSFQLADQNSGIFSFDSVANGVTTMAVGRNGHIKLDSIADELYKVSTHDQGYTYVFQPNGYFTWTIYLPIGTIDQIKNRSSNILATAFQINSPPVSNDPDQDGDYDFLDYFKLISPFANIFSLNALFQSL